MKSYRNLTRFILVPTLIALLAGCSPKSETPTDTGSSTETTSETTNESASEPAETSRFNYSEGIDENGFWEGIKALDYVSNIEYLGLTIPKDEYEISDEDIQTEINSMLEEYSTSEKVTNRNVVDGDTVNIVYVGSVDGVEFDGGSTTSEGTEVTIGVTSYIDDFLEQLIGHKPGETINVEVTFPDDYQATDLQGKDAVFVTTINYIVSDVIPELNDEFVTMYFSASDGWETVSEMREGLAATLKEEAIQQYITDYLLKNVTVSSTPDHLLEYQENIMLDYYREGAEYYGMDLDEFLTNYIGMTSDQLLENAHNGNMQSVAYSLTLQAIAEDAGISASEDDMVNYFGDYTQYVERSGLPYLKRIVLYQNVMNLMVDNAVLES